MLSKFLFCTIFIVSIFVVFNFAAKQAFSLQIRIHSGNSGIPKNIHIMGPSVFKIPYTQKFDCLATEKVLSKFVNADTNEHVISEAAQFLEPICSGKSHSGQICLVK